MDPFERMRRQLDETVKMFEGKTPYDDFDVKLYTLFSSALGQEVFNLLKQTFADRQLFVAGDSHASIYNLGQADFINFISDSIARVKGVDR